MELLQKQVQRLNHQQLQSVELLQMSALELADFLQDLSQENPVVDLEDSMSPAEARPEDELIHRLQWLEDNDRQNHYYERVEENELDPMARMGTAGGLEETLTQFLIRQLERMEVEEQTGQTVRYLISCLDENGYFRMPLQELAQETQIPLQRLEMGLELLRSMEPAGVGARDLAQCLALQLRRIGVEGTPVQIVENHLEDLAKCHYRSIAAKLGVTVDEVLQAQKVIRELEPRPGAVFEQPGQVPYILPDVFVEEKEGQFVVRTRTSDRPAFQINGYYRSMLSNTKEPEVREYLGKKIRQAEGVLWAIGQRESTLQRCVQAILERQTEFFRQGPCGLRQLRMADVAQVLGVHESTVSRAVREKYLQCRWGVYPLSYFFSRGAAAEPAGEQEAGGAAARAMLRQIIDGEDKEHPLSDQKLCQKLAEMGCAISRRTVAKYREEMGLPSAAGRKQR